MRPNPIDQNTAGTASSAASAGPAQRGSKEVAGRSTGRFVPAASAAVNVGALIKLLVSRLERTSRASMSRLREEQTASMSRLREEQTASMSRLREEQT